MTLKHFFVNGRIIDENGDGLISQFARGEQGDKTDQEIIRHFLRAIVVCHTVVPSRDEKTGGKSFLTFFAFAVLFSEDLHIYCL
jgi:hypothetical protein